MSKKRLLYLEDLYDFYSNKYKRSTHFSADKTGHQIFVQVPAQFEIAETDYVDNTLLFCKVKLMHSGENRNHSCVTDDALVKASKGLAYKPVLANFMEYTDKETGEILKDFTAHDMELNNDGSINYIEKQIGCFTSDEPFFEVEEETKHNFLYGYCAIPREYTDAVSIIERKGGTKISVELAINEMQYNSKSKVLELTDVIIMGATCLGKDPKTLKDVGEGMLNARLDIADFSGENNSIFTDYDSTLIEMQERLKKLESCFNINNNSRKEEARVEMNENFDEVTETVEVTETEETTEEEVTVTENESEETVDEASEDETENEEDSEETTDESDDEETEDDEVTVKEDNACGGGGSGSKKKKKNSAENEPMTRTYEISHDDIRYALYNLLSSYEESDNDWYYITGVYDSYFVYESWDGGKIYGQKYTKDNDNVAFDGERYTLHKEYLTDSEYTEIQNMRSNYSTVVNELNQYKYNEEFADKMTVFEDEAYTDYLETDEFKTLMSKETVDKYSKEELAEKADAALGKFVKSTKTFSYTENKTKKSIASVKVFSDVSKTRKPSRYGDLFKNE